MPRDGRATTTATPTATTAISRTSASLSSANNLSVDIGDELIALASVCRRHVKGRNRKFKFLRRIRRVSLAARALNRYDEVTLYRIRSDCAAIVPIGCHNIPSHLISYVCLGWCRNLKPVFHFLTRGVVMEFINRGKSPGCVVTPGVWIT